MLNEAENYQAPRQRTRFMWPATLALLITNAIVWLLEMWVVLFHPQFEIDKYFALSVEGLRHGYLWQLLTYQFMHAVPWPWHLLVNSWIIFVFGRIVEITLGKKRMLWLYFLSGTMGGLVQMAGMAFVPRLFEMGAAVGPSAGAAVEASVHAAVGASAGAFGLVAAFAMLYPRERLYVLLFFIVPLRMRATTFLWVAVAITLYGIFEPLFVNYLPSSLTLEHFFGNVAHAAHLGGIVTGCLLARQWALRRVRTRIVEPETKTSLKITPAPE